MANNVLDEPGKEEKNDGGTERDPVGASNGSVGAAGPSRLKSWLVKKECPYCHSKGFNLNRHLGDRFKMNRPGDVHDRDEIFKLRANAKTPAAPELGARKVLGAHRDLHTYMTSGPCQKVDELSKVKGGTR